MYACLPSYGQEPLRSSASDVPAPGVFRPALLPEDVVGLPIALVFYDLRGTALITGGDKRARAEILDAFGIREGAYFEMQLAEIGVLRVRQLPFVHQAHYTIFESSKPGHLVVSLYVDFGPIDSTQFPRGVATGSIKHFPVVYQDSSVSLKFLLNGGFGVFSEGNPWFGDANNFTGSSPIALSAADGPSATWFEASVEYGIGGVVQLGKSDFWLYGAGTFLTSFSSGQDLFRSDTRSKTAIEDGYLGGVVQFGRKPWIINASVGRQNWQLNDGFLFSQFSGSANAGPLPGLFLNPRTAYEMTSLIKVRHGRLSLEGFYLDPNEIEFLESRTTYAGLNSAYMFPFGLESSFAVYTVPRSKTLFRSSQPGNEVPREGQVTVNLRVAASRFQRLPGLDVAAEAAFQTHVSSAWRAWAYYGRVGYALFNFPWSPNISYRFSSFQGDDPTTEVYEGFDASLSSGLDTWVQGVSVRKVQSNSNLNTHRVRLNVAPNPLLSFTFDYFLLQVNEKNNLPSRIAQEVNLAMRWSINRNFFLLVVGGVAIPDVRLEAQAGDALKPWATLQHSLFWSF